MPGPISQFLAEDHARLDALLTRGGGGPGGVDLAAYGTFREGLLRHIAPEEKILLPAARTARGGEPVPQARRLRVDHGAMALAALLVPTPTPEIAAEMRKILGPHNEVEEGRQRAEADPCPSGQGRQRSLRDAERAAVGESVSSGSCGRQRRATA